MTGCGALPSAREAHTGSQHSSSTVRKDHVDRVRLHLLLVRVGQAAQRAARGEASAARRIVLRARARASVGRRSRRELRECHAGVDAGREAGRSCSRTGRLLALLLVLARLFSRRHLLAALLVRALHSGDLARHRRRSSSQRHHCPAARAPLLVLVGAPRRPLALLLLDARCARTVLACVRCARWLSQVQRRRSFEKKRAHSSSSSSRSAAQNRPAWDK